MADDGFRLPGTSFEQITKMIAAYGKFSQPVPPSEVAELLGTDQSSVSRNGAFLIGIGILEGSRAKQLTPIGRALARAIQYQNDLDIERNWYELLAANEFVEKIVAAVQIRRGMDRSALQSHIAYTSGQSKSSNVMTGANALIDMLTTSTLVTESEGRLVVNTRITDQDFTHVTGSKGENPAQTDTTKSNPEILPNPIQPTSNHLQVIPGLSIQIQLQCSVADLGTIGPLLKSLIKEISEDCDLPANETQISNAESDPED